MNVKKLGSTVWVTSMKWEEILFSTTMHLNNWRKKTDSIMKKNNDDEAADPDDFVIRISENKYQIGGVLFDEEACTLTRCV